MIWKKFFSHTSDEVRRYAVAVILLSFLVGSAGGAVFGVVGAMMVAKQGGRGPVGGFFMKPDVRNGAPSNAVTPSGTTIDVVKKSSPAVVSIVITKDIPQIIPNQLFPNSPFGDDFFNNFFGIPNTPSPSTPPKTKKQEVGGGTGFFVSPDGLIVTNKHVVADTEAEYTVLTNDGKKFSAKVLARDTVNDLAIVKIEGKNFPTLSLGDSSSIQLGQSVVAIGNALGEFRNTVSTGVISGLSRSVTAGGSELGVEQLNGVIQTDAAINPGNSGGPLLDLNGQVIGINTAVAQGAQNIGFAIPVNKVKQVIESVQKNGRIVRPFLGVRYVLITSAMAKEQQLPVDHGALVVRGDTQTDLAVTPGSPADKAGITENDIIIEVDGKEINEENQLGDAIANHNVGDSLTLKVLHRGETKTISIKLVERKQ